jgi:hypothetical protein
MRGDLRGVARIALTYSAIGGLIFFLGRWWGGGPPGARWAGDGWTPRVPSATHHFYPASTQDIAAVLAAVAALSLIVIATRGVRAQRLVAAIWSLVALALGSLLLAVPHLQVIAIEPGSIQFGHVVPPAVAALLLPLGLALALMAFADFRAWRPMFWGCAMALTFAVGIFSEIFRRQASYSMRWEPLLQESLFLAAALVGAGILVARLRNRR